jgi:hypothetical protein
LAGRVPHTGNRKGEQPSALRIAFSGRYFKRLVATGKIVAIAEKKWA